MGGDAQNCEEVESKEEVTTSTPGRLVWGQCKCETEELSCQPCNPMSSEGIEVEVEQEAERQFPAADPGQPTQAEIEEHELSHSPFRPWCAACVCGRAQDAPSRKVKGLFAEHVLPRVRMDYCFLTEEVEEVEGEHGEEKVVKSGATLTVMVMQESLTRSVWAYAVANKGSREDWVIDQVLNDLETVGLRNERIVLKSDQENAITDVLKEVQKRRECDFGTALDASKVGDSDSNGTIEAAIKGVEGMARTLRFALEAKLQKKMSIDSPVMPWLIRHSGHLITRCWIRPSGRTSYQMIKGRRSNAKLIAFGEAVMFRVPHGKTKPGKFEEMWESGVYLGFDIRTGEDLVGTPDGVFRAATVRRKPLAERWSAEMLDRVAGTPAAPVPGSSSARSPAYARKFARTQEQRDSPVFVEQPVPPVPQVRGFKILKTDIEEHGVSENCPGCRAIARGASYKAAHTALCRARFEARLMESEEGKARLSRADDRLNHELVRRAGAEPFQERAQQGGGEEASASARAPPNSEADLDAPSAKRASVRGQKRQAEGPSNEEWAHIEETSGRLPAPAPAVDTQRLPEGTLPSVRAALFGKDAQVRGSKRPAEGPAEDGDRGDEVGVVSQGELDPTRTTCGCCETRFESRNLLFEHLREEDHSIVSDGDDESIEGSPPGTEDDRRGVPAEIDEDSKGGTPQSKPVDVLTHRGISKGQPGPRVERSQI